MVGSVPLTVGASLAGLSMYSCWYAWPNGLNRPGHGLTSIGTVVV